MVYSKLILCVHMHVGVGVGVCVHIYMQVHVHMYACVYRGQMLMSGVFL